MALEAMTFQQELPGYNIREFHNIVGVNWNCDFGLVENELEQGCIDSLNTSTQGKDYNGNWNCSSMVQDLDQEHLPTTISTTRQRRRRSRSTKKNKEEIENQRMTHITIERNRRKQMNEYLNVLRGLMPESYAQKGDQASIIGGAINYVKELEQQLHFCSGSATASSSSSPFAEFFTFPHYSTAINYGSATADIQVTIVDSYANLKIRSNKRLKQLSRMVSGLECLKLTILHLNVITVDQTVLYSLSLKVEDDCSLTSVDEIAAAVNQMIGKIQEERE